MTDSDAPQKPRALSYTEMMNSGRQRLEVDTAENDVESKERDPELEGKGEEHLQKSDSPTDSFGSLGG